MAFFVALVVFLMPLAAFAAGGTLHIDGNAGVPLAFNQSGDGWNWVAGSQTLALDSAYSGKLIYFNTSDTIYLVYSGNVTIISAIDMQALCSDGDLLISGSGGTLTLKSSGGFEALAADSITIGGDAVIYAESDDTKVITAYDGDVTIKENASVTVKGTGADTTGIYSDSGGITIDTTGAVDVTATGAAFALDAGSQIDIKNGTVDITAADKALAFMPGPTYTGGVVKVNGTVIYGSSGDGGGGCDAGVGMAGALALLLSLRLIRKRK